MKIQITGRHVDVTEAIRDFAEDKVSTLQKYGIKIMKAHVLIEVQHNIHHKCEINIEMKGHRYSSHADTKNMYDSISKCIDKLAQQIKSHKYSSSDKKHRKSTAEFEQEMIAAEIEAEQESLSLEQPA